MASKEEKSGSKPSPGRNLLPDDAASVAGAFPPPRDPRSTSPTPGAPTPGRDLPQEEAGGVAGAYPPPRDVQGSGGQVPEPGLNLEIETLGGAVAGAASPTIKVKINTSLDAD